MLIKEIEFDKVRVYGIYFIGRRVSMKMDFEKDEKVESFSFSGKIETSKEFVYGDDLIISEIFDTRDFDTLIKDGIVEENENLNFSQSFRLNESKVIDDDNNLIFCIGSAITKYADNDEFQEDLCLKFDKGSNNIDFKLNEKQKQIIQHQIIELVRR